MDEKKVEILRNIEIPVFSLILNLAIGKTCGDAIEVGETMKEAIGHLVEESKSWFGAYLHSEEMDICAIVLSEDAGVNTIAHECFHATMHMLRLKGAKYSHKSEECFAYFLGYLVEKVHNVMDEYKEICSE